MKKLPILASYLTTCIMGLNIQFLDLNAQEIAFVSTNPILENKTVSKTQETSCKNHNLAGAPILNFSPEENAKIQRRAFSLCRIGYFSYFDPATKTPLWVSENLNDKKINADKENRTENFTPDPNVPKSAQATLQDYKGSRFDRGHMAPAADMSIDTSLEDLKNTAMSESFYLTNMIPQVGINMNRGIWADLEAQVREWAEGQENLLIVTGPIFDNKKNPTVTGRSKVWVPTRIYKVIYNLKSGASIAFVLPNVQIVTEKTKSFDIGNPEFPQTLKSKSYDCGSVCSLSNFVTTVAEVEKITNLKFFPVAPRENLTSTNLTQWPISR